MTLSEKPPHRPRRLLLYAPYVALLLVVLGWSGFWWLASGRVHQVIDEVIAREAAAGRQWACPNRSVGGFPFRFELTCREPTFTQADGAAGSLGLARIVAQAYQPNHVIGEFTGPLRLRDRGGSAGELNWTTARSSLRTSGGQLARFDLEVEAPTFTITPVAGLATQGNARRFEIHARGILENAPPGRYDVSARLQRLSYAPLDDVLVNREPLDLLFDTTVLNLTTILPKDRIGTLEAWRGNNGVFKLENLSILKGPLKFDARGDLSLDDGRRPAGRIDVNLVGADAVLRRFNLMPRGAAGNVLGALFGGNGAIKLPLTLQNGRASLGPIPLGPVPALY
jgi:hypothetical protein